MKKKIATLAFAILSIISLCAYIGIVAYNWGYMQSAIDNHVATFSAPANIAIFAGLQFIIAAVIFAVISVVIFRKK